VQDLPVQAVLPGKPESWSLGSPRKLKGSRNRVPVEPRRISPGHLSDLVCRKETTSVRDLSVAEIAKTPYVATSIFVYFEDVPEAVLTVATSVTQSTPELMAEFTAAWVSRDAYARSLRFVKAYVAHWRAHAAIFRARNLAADEGDLRFIRARRGAVRPLMRLMALRIEERQALGALPVDLHAPSAAGAVLSLLERSGVLQEPAWCHRARQ